MSENGSNSLVPPYVAIYQMMTGYWVSQAVYVAARLGVADLLANGPRPIEELAAMTQAHAPSLKRLLRALASIGVFTENSPEVFALTPMAALLRKDTPDSMRALAIMYNEDQYLAWGDFLYSVQTGKPAFEQHFGSNYFPYISQHPEAGRVFNEAMTSWSSQLSGAVVDAYDFSPFQTIVDVGGGQGALLAGILRCNPTTKGILYDQTHVVAAAKEFLMNAGVAERCAVVGGDFFVDVPSGGDVYILSGIVHDWDDERCLSILKHCRQVMPANGKLLVIELVMPSGQEPSVSKWVDLHMLVLNQGGRERTTSEYDVLFRAAGFAITRVIRTTVPHSIVEAVPA